MAVEEFVAVWREMLGESRCVELGIHTILFHLKPLATRLDRMLRRGKLDSIVVFGRACTKHFSSPFLDVSAVVERQLGEPRGVCVRVFHGIEFFKNLGANILLEILEVISRRVGREGFEDCTLNNWCILGQQFLASRVITRSCLTNKV
jgi:hypothetical protein